MSKHTKGEWFFKRHGWSTVYIESRIGNGVLQEIAACGPTANGSEEQEANARLIAAAPDLLEALENLLADYQSLSDSGDAGFLCIEGHPIGKAAYAAIARAKG